MPHNPRIYILVGPPGCGKSTWRERHLATHPDRATITLSSDDLIEEAAAADGVTYSQAFLAFDHKAADKVLNERLNAAVLAKCDIIVDRTNMTAKSRRRFLAQVPKSYETVAVVFQVPRETLNMRLARRAEATGKSIPASVVDDMIERFEMPEIGEFDIVETIGEAVAPL